MRPLSLFQIFITLFLSLVLSACNVTVSQDADNDGVPDSSDAFPNDPTETLYTDGDGIGNNADGDDDGDGYLDLEDPYPLDPSLPTTTPNPTSNDTDGDGVVNAELDSTLAQFAESLER